MRLGEEAASIWILVLKSTALLRQGTLRDNFPYFKRRLIAKSLTHIAVSRVITIHRSPSAVGILVGNNVSHRSLPYLGDLLEVRKSSPAKQVV